MTGIYGLKSWVQRSAEGIFGGAGRMFNWNLSRRLRRADASPLPSSGPSEMGVSQNHGSQVRLWLQGGYPSAIQTPDPWSAYLKRERFSPFLRYDTVIISLNKVIVGQHSEDRVISVCTRLHVLVVAARRSFCYLAL